MLAKEIMCKTKYSARKTESIKNILKIFQMDEAEFVLVENEIGQCIGTITKEVIMDAYLQGISVSMPVEAIMDKNFIIMNENQSLEDFYTENRQKIVVSDHKGRVTGIISEKIFMKSIINLIYNEKSDEGIGKEQIYDLIDKDLDESINLIKWYKYLQNIVNKNNELNEIIQSSSDSIYVTDGEGNTLWVNKAFEEITGIKRAEVINKNVKKLEREGIFSPSVSSLVLKEKRKITIIQKMKNGKEAVVTGVPVFSDKGDIYRVISNSKDFEELNILNNYLIGYKMQNYDINKKNQVNGERIIFESEKMKELFQLAKMVAKVDSTILITGESGVGKEVLARFIHEHSNRANEKFVQINCGAIPESLLESELFGYEIGAFTGAKKNGKLGLIEISNNGTLFLDEIGELPLNLQVKLLQVIQNKQITRVGGTKSINVDNRIIVATNRDLNSMVSMGQFRLDLFYRLNVVPLHIPPLRERCKDIIPLAQYFLNRFNKQYNKQIKLVEEIYDKLQKYYWPGNIRELENVIERIVVTTNQDMPHNKGFFLSIDERGNSLQNPIIINEILPLNEAVKEVERQIVRMAYATYNNSYKLAEVLKISQSSAHRKIKEYIEEN